MTNPSLRRIGIVTDSSCDLPEAVIAAAGISVVPLTVRLDGRDYLDRDELRPESFWNLVRTTDSIPETAAPSVGRFAAAFDRLADEGVDGAVTVCISSRLSGTFQAATLAAEAASNRIPVRVIDSKVASAALGLTALAAAESAAAGSDIDDVAAVAVSVAERTRVLAALDTLEFLRRGGRIGGAAAFFGGLLDVKPLIAVQEGVVAAAGRVRTRRKAVAALLEAVAEQAADITQIAVVHGDAPDHAAFATEVGHRLPGIDPIVTLLGPVVGSHTGPGLIGVCFRLG